MLMVIFFSFLDIAENSLMDLFTTIDDLGVSSFISDEDFAQLSATKRVTQEAIDWCDLPLHVVYQVEGIVPLTKWGAQVILQLKNNAGDEIKVWAPANVSKELKSGTKLYGVNVYIKSLGQKEAKTTTRKKRYYDFETVYL